jgi:hypothetical protein
MGEGLPSSGLDKQIVHGSKRNTGDEYDRFITIAGRYWLLVISIVQIATLPKPRL